MVIYHAPGTSNVTPRTPFGLGEYEELYFLAGSSTCSIIMCDQNVPDDMRLERAIKPVLAPENERIAPTTWGLVSLGTPSTMPQGAS